MHERQSKTMSSKTSANSSTDEYSINTLKIIKSPPRDNVNGREDRFIYPDEPLSFKELRTALSNHQPSERLGNSDLRQIRHLLRLCASDLSAIIKFVNRVIASRSTISSTFLKDCYRTFLILKKNPALFESVTCVTTLKRISEILI